ncbi:MAG TPA: DUF1178 family protein [Parvibaculum sp.]|uniref:DUF1178 family protein n=1 Tax=Parvibaculum sp. TaxID=2024848 RepID=UPI002BCE7202|nr:DUF1178 family protein [Parvibaculum sp.]HMM15559.1 DUF1178 family protein [Parvibaculum sp.]
MIRYALLCKKDHEFDGWFRSSSLFDEQVKAGEVSCPVCGSRDIRKALMAPNIAKGGSEKRGEKADAAQKFSAMMMALRKHVEENCDYVGDAFAETARRIHYGEEEARDIYGEVTQEDARSLIEEGVDVAPLPVVPPRQAN